jgi:hypothetical protein
MLNFYRWFTPEAASIQAPLHAALAGPKVKGSQPVDWTPTMVRAFEDCKASLSHVTLLAHPDPSATLALFTDASDIALGATLQQRVCDAWQPLAFYSHKLSPAQRQDNVVADALSRASSATTPLDYHALASSQNHDAELQDILKNGSALRLERMHIPGTDVRLYCDTSSPQPRPFITTPFRCHVFDTLHGLSHPGANATVKLVSQRFVWLGVGKDCRAWTRACTPCQRSKVTWHVKAPLGSFSLPSAAARLFWLPVLSHCHRQIHPLA